MIILITSAAYVNMEMAAEIGLIPPAFLPLGTQRLINYQVSCLRGLKGIQIERICLSLPESFIVDHSDKVRLEQAGVECILVPDSRTLGQSILHCLNQPGMEGPIAILHGDTLVGDEIVAQALGDAAGNVCVVASAPGSYSWGRAFVRDGRFLGAISEQPLLPSNDTNARDVLVGLFAFRDVSELREALQCSNSDFVTALSRMAYLNDIRAVSCQSWTDFGHLQTYYKSRVDFASARAFNNLRIASGVVRKSGLQDTKIRAEAYWFENLPPHLKPYSARLITSGPLSDDNWYYETEYEYMPTLQELFVFGRLPDGTWDEILRACCRCLDAFLATPIPGVPQDALLHLIRDKTWERIDCFECQSGLDLSRAARLGGQTLPPPRAIAEEMIAVVSAAPQQATSAMHGDFCFSNILFNGRTQSIRLIDPRGTLDGTSFTCGGDIRYDMAKLAHSVIGLYDLIIAGRIDCRHHGGVDFDLAFDPAPGSARLMVRFAEARIGGLRFGDPVILAAMVLLFLSMLPLHADRPDRQKAFLANALRLYSEHFKGL